jgi:hypothetical protein
MPRNDVYCATSFAMAAAVLVAACPVARADPDGFAAFAGSYRGSGVVLVNDGRRERITCRATGAVGGGGRTISQNIVCASDSYRFDIRGQMVASGSDVTGDWQEATRGVGGDVRGRIADDHFSGVVNAVGFTASFLLHAVGRRLGFSMRPSDSSIVRIDVNMSR